jgi:hypothetical protein
MLGQEASHMIVDADNMRNRANVSFQDTNQLGLGGVNAYRAHTRRFKFIYRLERQMQQHFLAGNKGLPGNKTPVWRVWQYGASYRPRQCDDPLADPTNIAKIVNDQSDAGRMRCASLIPGIECKDGITPCGARYKQNACRQVEPVCTRTANHYFSLKWISIDFALQNPAAL